MSKNIIDISLDHTNQTHRDFLFYELMNDNNSTENNYENLSKSINSDYINIQTNFDDLFGFNYSSAFNGIDYNSYEFYFGTSTIKYISILNSNKEIEYSNNTLKTETKDIIFLGIINYAKTSMKSSKIETIDPEKKAALSDDVRPLVPANSTTRIYRNYDLEKFTISTENLYDTAKEDAEKKETYLLPVMFNKSFKNNISLYGVLILGYTQENYTNIQNYFKDANGTKHNIIYSTKVTDNKMNLNKDAATIQDKQNYVARYRGYHYGYKITLQYKINNISLYTTAYQKTTILRNKYKTTPDQLNIASDSNNVVIYDTLKYKERYLNFGIKYRF
jgi:hypothetical protein